MRFPSECSKALVVLCDAANNGLQASDSAQMNHSALRDRFLRDSLPIRLWGLAANLARVQSFCDNPAHLDVVARLLGEHTPGVWTNRLTRGSLHGN